MYRSWLKLVNYRESRKREVEKAAQLIDVNFVSVCESDDDVSEVKPWKGEKVVLNRSSIP